MALHFYKYQGTGNDFIMLDNRNGLIRNQKELAIKLCKRKFGIGSDGLILIENSKESDFEMIFYNPDGSQSFCGNGSRCAVAFANFLGIINTNTSFVAIDGKHKAILNSDKTVSLKMNDVENIERGSNYYYLNTGSPHYIAYTDNIEELNLVDEGRKIRYNNRFAKEGTNVNFVKKNKNFVEVRTYERGVENETLSCGTGVTAVALSTFYEGLTKNSCIVKTKGGELSVNFEATNKGFQNIWLTGPAKLVFKGEIND